ncbi:hypothetical protein RD149_15020 [Gordonia westfalica]|uniref:Uncharacterized protein n=1 Tax=Gordonia westfalica TaxID=158898 RepID=A0ABU2GVM8_9ACTN|nr:hypothetical protein [Gordonia westfalica]
MARTASAGEPPLDLACGPPADSSTDTAVIAGLYPYFFVARSRAARTFPAGVLAPKVTPPPASPT